MSASPGSDDERLPLHLVSPVESEPDSLRYDVSISFMPMPLSTGYAANESEDLGAVC